MWRKELDKELDGAIMLTQIIKKEKCLEKSSVGTVSFQFLQKIMVAQSVDIKFITTFYIMIQGFETNFLKH